MERSLAAILAADVMGRSCLMGDDEAGTLAKLKAHRKECVARRSQSTTVAWPNSWVMIRRFNFTDCDR